MTKKISTFDNEEHVFLSNFYPYKSDGGKYSLKVTVLYNGIVFDCVENAYQAAKTKDKSLQEKFSKMSPYEIKKYWESNQDIRPEWNNIKLELMRDLVFQKFKNNSQLARLLLQTGDTILEEGNEWGDTFWGISQDIGENNLGKILMYVRNKLKE